MAGSPDNKATETSQRFLTSILLLPILGLVWYGGWPAIALYLLAGGLMADEALRVVAIARASMRGLAISALVLAPAAMMAFGLFGGAMLTMMLLAGLGLVLLARSWVMAVLMVCLMLTIGGATGLAIVAPETPWLLLVAVTIIAADSSAYFVGKRIGGPKLAPRISPSKTWSGAIAGLCGGGLVAVVVGMSFDLPVTVMALTGLVVADLSIGGDLLESMFKRAHGVKDAGSILPGHGGILDRCDGYLLSVPVVFAAVYGGVLHG